MDVAETTQVASPRPKPEAPDAPQAFTHCEECGAPVDHDQRYCVSCGAHRRHVADPAARYFSGATARTRTAAARTPISPAQTRASRSAGLGAAVLLALIPAAVAVGIAVGRSSNNDDAKLISALSRSRAQTAAPAQPTAATATTAATAAGPVAKKHPSRSATKGRSRHHATTSTSKVPSHLNGHASTAQKQQGQAIVNRLQKTNGTSYMNQLPSQVVVP
jgi:hypothetical protein